MYLQLGLLEKLVVIPGTFCFMEFSTYPSAIVEDLQQPCLFKTLISASVLASKITEIHLK